MLREQAGPVHLAVLRYILAAVFLLGIYGCRRLYRRLGRQAQPPRAQLAAYRGEPVSSGIQPELATLTVPPVANAAIRRWILVSMVLGLTMFALPDLLLRCSAQHGAAPFVPLIYAALPLGLLLWSGELRAPAILGLGAMLVLLNGSLPLNAAKLGWALPIVCAVALQGWSLVYARRHLAAGSSLPGVIVQLLSAAWILQVSLRVWPEAQGVDALRQWPGESLAALCVLAGLATAMAYPLYYRLLARLEPGQLAISEWLQTLVAIAESAILMRQHPGWPMIGAACVLVVCAGLLLRPSSRTVAAPAHAWLSLQ
jgi:drug/metabolite transporter (DMT)-like permease